MKIGDAGAVRAIDARAMRLYGLKELQLMENAGRAVAEAVAYELDRRPVATKGRVSIIVGKGNNGGDGFVAARHLVNMGVDVSVISLVPLSSIKGNAGVNAKVWLKMGGVCSVVRSARALKARASELRHAAVIVDGIFGTGLSSPVKGIYASAIEFINGLGKKVVAIDIPSGIDATTGDVLGAAVKADVTITMVMGKLGHYLYPGREYAGKVRLVDIGLPMHLVDVTKLRWNLITREMIAGFLKPRKPESHKGTYGHVLVAGGSLGKTGAARLAAMGALRAGAGLSTIALPAGLNSVMEAETLEVMTSGLPETPEGTLGAASYKALVKLARGKSAIVVGPGLGTSVELSSLVESIIKGIGLPLVLDADALNAISLRGRLGVLKKAAKTVVLTPHPGEMARLLKKDVKAVQADRVKAATALAKKSGCVVVLKGAATVVADPAGEVYINPTGNAGLASAGTGDVLSGLIGGFLATGLASLDAALAGVYIHGLSADEIKRRRGEAGMIATDVLERIPATIKSVLSGKGGRARRHGRSGRSGLCRSRRTARGKTGGKSRG